MFYIIEKDGMGWVAINRYKNYNDALEYATLQAKSYPKNNYSIVKEVASCSAEVVVTVKEN